MPRKRALSERLAEAEDLVDRLKLERDIKRLRDKRKDRKNTRR